MAKIDTSKIEGYANMTPEQKLAALEGFEYEDNSAELEKQKNALSKANSEAAEWKRKHNALLSEEEQELADLRKGKTVSEYKAKFVAQGYDEALAEETAKALADGDSAKVFANQSKFLEEYAKKVKADAIKKTPKPGAGAGSGSGTEDAVDYGKKIEEAQKNGDITAVAYYTRLKAQAEAEAKGE